MSFAQFPNHSGLIHIEITHNICLQDLDRTRLRTMSKSTLAEANDRDYSVANRQPVRQHITTIVFTYRNLSGTPTLAQKPAEGTSPCPIHVCAIESNTPTRHGTPYSALHRARHLQNIIVGNTGPCPKARGRHFTVSDSHLRNRIGHTNTPRNALWATSLFPSFANRITC